MKENLFGKTHGQLAELVEGLGMPRFSAGQIASWLYPRGVRSIDGMTNISAAHRATLAERFEIVRPAPAAESVSRDGTKKYLFENYDHFSSKVLRCCADRSFGAEDSTERTAEDTKQEGVTDECFSRKISVEAVMIPEADRATLCLSSQAGCRMGCTFCATGRMGLARDLSTAEILNQFASLPERGRNAGGDLTCAGKGITNIVYMGMGEPLDNLDAVLGSLEILTAPWGYGLSPSRITLSTAGIAPALERFLTESRVHLAVSLHNPFADERAALMPVERAYPIEGILDIVRRHFMRDHSGPTAGSGSSGPSQRRVSFEYIVLDGLNDSPRHVAGLARLLNGLSCRINLIRFHKIPGSPFFSPPDAAVERFAAALAAKGLRTTIRASRGEDIEAACGLLANATRI